jgi:hypothetical protein
MDGKKFTTMKPSMLARELRELTDCQSQYQLYREGNETDTGIDSSETVSLAGQPHFYTVPPATW